jgi:hypothetical protein
MFQILRKRKRGEMGGTQPEGLSAWFLRELHGVLNPRPLRYQRGVSNATYLRWWRLQHPHYHRDKQREYRARDAALRERGYL